MTVKPQLVLDLAGVLVSNFSSAFLGKISLDSNVSFQDMKVQFDEIRKELWTGEMKEEQFWTWLSERIKIDKEEARGQLINSLEPFPAINYLEHWSRSADIHILSNHCHEWLEPILCKIKPYTISVTISNQVGLRKPDILIYKHVEQFFKLDEDAKPTVLYVDDQEKNLKPAVELGWSVLLADKENKWLNKVEPILSSVTLSHISGGEFK